jgi:hypothetical protein
MAARSRLMRYGMGRYFSMKRSLSTG